ncbi:uncharacterized protein ACBT44_017091 [Syngnathus typhle]
MDSFLSELMWILFLSVLTFFTSNAACPSRCECLSNGKVTCIGDTITDIPTQLPNHTYTLILGGTNMDVISEQSLEKMKLMTRFSLVFSHLHTIHPGAFRFVPQLKSLKLSSNDLSTLHVRVFSPLVALEELYLNENRLEAITADMFEELVALQDLDLSYNKLSSVPSEAFSKLVNLEILNIGNNDLKTLSPTTFHSLIKLNKLSIHKNQLKKLEPGMFDGLVNLEYLQIYSNKIATIPPEVFWPLKKLKNLTLSSNKLQNIPERSFYNMPKLFKLTIYNNPLLSLPDELMGHMPEMPEFYLYDTNLITVPGNLFANMSWLRTLNLHFNDRLSDLPPDLFCCLPELQKLSLKSNNLQQLRPKHFSRLTKLEILLLNNNTLKNLPQNIFQELGQLRMLDLNGNRLKNLPQDIFKFNRFVEVVLSGNPWDCTCSINALVKWIKLNRHAVLESDDVICHSPQYQILRTLDSLHDEELNNCNMTTVTPSCTRTQEPTQESSWTTPTATEVASSPQPNVKPDEISSTYDIQSPFHDIVVVEEGHDFVHHNYHSGWVYVWFLPSKAVLAGFLMFSHILLVATGMFLIVANMYAMHLLCKRANEIKEQFARI